MNERGHIQIYEYIFRNKCVAEKENGKENLTNLVLAISLARKKYECNTIYVVDALYVMVLRIGIKRRSYLSIVNNVYTPMCYLRFVMERSKNVCLHKL